MKNKASGSIEKQTARSSGRPPKTSQQAIIACAIEILEKEPDAGVSLNRIAKTMNISPMSIYNYFASRDKLLQALSSHLLAELQLPADANAPWQQRIVGWAVAVRAHFKRIPYLIELLVWEGNMSTAWLRHWLMINDVLRTAGLRDDALTQTTLWVTQTIMSAIHTELLALSAPTASDDDLALPDTLLYQLNAIRAFANRPGYHERNFNYLLQRLLDALALQIAQINFDTSSAVFGGTFSEHHSTTFSKTISANTISNNTIFSDTSSEE
ncbi:MAG TPA: TetR/AcrR family transcriptional regulator [Spongiibacteraceae bacterium]|nr:TetR/AcrR family transcriptional regulator [Spongiibacteraceae bacterium]